MSSSTKSPKALAAEATLDAFLNQSANMIGSHAEDSVIKLMRSLPPGVDEEKIRNVLRKMFAYQFFRFCSSFPKMYVPVLRDMLRTLQSQPHGAYASPMMLECLYVAAQKDMNDPAAYNEFGEVGKFLHYLTTLQFAVEKPEQFAKSDKLITPAVADAIAYTLTTLEARSEDSKPFNSMVYALGRVDSKKTEEAVRVQMGRRDRYTDRIMAMALKPHRELPNTSKGYQLIADHLRTVQKESLSYSFVKAMGLDPDFDLEWSIKLDSEHPNAYIRAEITNDGLSLRVKGPSMKKEETGNTRSGILVANAFRKIDFLNLHSEMDAIAGLFGIEYLDWKKVKVTVSGFDKSATKIIKEHLLR